MFTGEMVDLKNMFEGLCARVLGIESNTTDNSRSTAIFDVILKFSKRYRYKANLILRNLSESSLSVLESIIFNDKRTLTTNFGNFLNYKIIKTINFKAIRLG